jgi:hypothetical protein
MPPKPARPRREIRASLRAAALSSLAACLLIAAGVFAYINLSPAFAPDVPGGSAPESGGEGMPHGDPPSLPASPGRDYADPAADLMPDLMPPSGHSFSGTVYEVFAGMIGVKPAEGYDYDYVYVLLNSDYVYLHPEKTTPSFVSGDEVTVYYNGVVSDSYPVQIPGATAIVVTLKSRPSEQPPVSQPLRDHKLSGVITELLGGGNDGYFEFLVRVSDGSSALADGEIVYVEGTSLSAKWPEAGDTVTVVYDGAVEKTNPPGIHNAEIYLETPVASPGGTVEPFSFDEHKAMYPAGTPGVAMGGFALTEAGKIDDGYGAYRAALREIEMKLASPKFFHDGAKVYYDGEADVWLVEFRDSAAVGGGQSVYIGGDGVTLMIVYSPAK